MNKNSKENISILLFLFYNYKNMKKFLVFICIFFIFSCENNSEIYEKDEISIEKILEEMEQPFEPEINLKHFEENVFPYYKNLKFYTSEWLKKLSDLEKVEEFPFQITIWWNNSKEEIINTLNSIVKNSKYKNIEDLQIIIPRKYFTKDVLEIISDIKFTRRLDIIIFPLEKSEFRKKIFIPEEFSNLFIEKSLKNQSTDEKPKWIWFDSIDNQFMIYNLCEVENQEKIWDNWYNIFCWGLYFLR